MCACAWVRVQVRHRLRAPRAPRCAADETHPAVCGCGAPATGASKAHKIGIRPITGGLQQQQQQQQQRWLWWYTHGTKTPDSRAARPAPPAAGSATSPPGRRGRDAARTGAESRVLQIGGDDAAPARRVGELRQERQSDLCGRCVVRRNTWQVIWRLATEDRVTWIGRRRPRQTSIWWW